MANKPITGLPAAGGVSNADLLAIVRGGATEKMTVSQLADIYANIGLTNISAALARASLGMAGGPWSVMTGVFSRTSAGNVIVVNSDRSYWEPYPGTPLTVAFNLVSGFFEVSLGTGLSLYLNALGTPAMPVITTQFQPGALSTGTYGWTGKILRPVLTGYPDPHGTPGTEAGFELAVIDDAGLLVADPNFPDGGGDNAAAMTFSLVVPR